MRLDGKTAIITGGASGIGEASAELFLSEGAQVAVVDRDRDRLDALKRRCPDILVFPAEVSDMEAASRIVADVSAAFGEIDILMTCAGISVSKTLEDTSPEDWAEVFRISVTGTFVWMKTVLPTMRAGSSVITVASQLAVAGGRRNAAHIAAKGAVVSLSKTTALDVADRNIRVNCILPGAIDTPALARNLSRQPDPDGAREWFRNRHPLKRFGRAAEVAEAALYLASDAASFTTGIVLPVDGGWLAA